MRTVRFGIIGCGLMGRAFAAAVSRWCELVDMPARPEIVAICNRTPSEEKTGWFRRNFPTVKQVTDDYRKLLDNPQVDAVYVAVPHNRHEEIFCAALDAGKHLLGEKPFGMDLTANEKILAKARANPKCHIGCASQYIYYPAVQRILAMMEQGNFGQIVEVESGFLHSSDLNPDKPMSWKRTIEINGEYGVMGDLGPHIGLVAFRAGWVVENTYAICSKIIDNRPDSAGRLIPCETWDNVTMLSQVKDPATGSNFPWRLRLARIMPGEMNTWYLYINGTKASARFSLKNPRILQVLEYKGGEQAWQNIDMGFQTAYKTITGGIFEFGTLDAFMQMVAAFMYELSHDEPLSRVAACPTAEEMHQCHRLFTAALQSHRIQNTVKL
jgi:predicted dehydrogenase